MKPTKQAILAEFQERFKNPENTGYRVGQEFLGAVEYFIEETIDQIVESVPMEFMDIKKEEQDEWLKGYRDGNNDHADLIKKWKQEVLGDLKGDQ